jgi:hypothetical protein
MRVGYNLRRPAPLASPRPEIRMSKLLAAVLTVIALSASPASAQVKIGLLVSATGPTSAIGIPQRNTGELLPPRIGDTTIEYIQLEDGGDTTRAVQNARKLISEHRVDAIIGPSTTPNALAILDIDANGILHVSAKDKATSKENKITIKANSGLTEAEIEQMVKDAEAHAEDDRKQLEEVEARNGLDTLVHGVKKSLAEYGEKIGADEKAKVEAAVKEAEELLKKPDATKDALTKQAEDLAKAAQKIGELMYAEAQAKAQPQADAADTGAGGAGRAGGGEQRHDEKVVDAEFTEVKDRKG